VRHERGEQFYSRGEFVERELAIAWAKAERQQLEGRQDA
jgi:hypothetical protein